MKKKKILLFAVLIAFSFILNISIFPAYAATKDSHCSEEADEDDLKDSGLYADEGSSVIDIDGSFDDWDDVPYSYEYNWDNPYIYYYQWNPVTQKNETVTITDENGKPYNTTIRHKMSLYRDDENVYLHIIIAKQYDYGFNGNNYIFYCDGQQVQFQICMPGGGTINKNSFGQGLHKLQVRHENSSRSSSAAGNSEAILKRSANGINDEVEIKIPFKEFQKQNSKIDPDNIRVLEFFTPNLMYRRISCAGTGTAPYIGIAICILASGAGYVYYNKKRKLIV